MEYPGEGNTHGHLSVIGRVGLRGPHHGAVALVREHRQGIKDTMPAQTEERYTENTTRCYE